MVKKFTGFFVSLSSSLRGTKQSLAYNNRSNLFRGLNSLRFHTTLRLHQKLTKLKWYKRWHDFRFSHHVHVVALLGYTAAILVLGITTVFFQPSTKALAAAGSSSQTTFNGTSDGTYTGTEAKNANIDAGLANSGYNSYGYKKDITFNTTSSGANVATAQTNFPIAVNINSSSWPTAAERNNFFGAYNNNGKRVRFYDADSTTNLAYRVSYYNSGTQEAVYWVKVPQVDGNSSTDKITVFYGNDPYGSDQNSATVWSDNYAAVYLFSEGSGTTVADDSGHGKTLNLGTATWSNSGPFKECITYTSGASVGSAPTTNTQNYALEAMTSPTAPSSSQTLIWNGASNNGWGFYVYQVTPGDFQGYMPGVASQDFTPSVYPDGGTHHEFLTRNTSTTSAWIDGNSKTVANSTSTPITPTDVTIQSNSAGIYYVAISSVVRTADFQRLSYYSKKKTSWVGDGGGTGAFVAWGSQSASSVSGTFTSALIQPTGLYGNWGTLTYSHCDATHNTGQSPNNPACTGTYTGTAVAVDVLNGATGATILTDVATGTNLNLSTATYLSLKIRVNLSTSNPTYTPLLSDWNLAYSYDTTPPTVPTGLTIGTVTSSSVPLTWTASTDAESGVVGYEVQRAPDSAGVPGTWANVATGGCSGTIATTSCTDGTVSQSTKYYYRVRAKDAIPNYSGYGYSAETTIDNVEYSSDTTVRDAYVTNAVPTGTTEITNGNFETWSGGANVAPDGWTFWSNGAGTGTRESTIVKSGTYSGKVYSPAGIASTFYRDISAAKGLSYWKGKTVTIGGWMNTSDISYGELYINDGVGEALAFASSPSTWQYKTASLTISQSATQLQIGTRAWGGSTSYFDDVIVVEGALGWPLQSYKESTIKTQGSYSLKGDVTQTTGLNKTLTKTFASPLNLSDKTSIRFDMMATRTGSNIKLGIHDTGGTTTEITPSISTTGVYQTVTWDLGSLVSTNKDAIDSLIVTVTNADTANTFYIDNIQADNYPSATTLGVIVPTGLNLTNVTSNVIRVNWAKTTDADLSGYKIERATDSSGNPTGWTEVASLTTAQLADANNPYWDDTGRAANTKYYYRDRAYTPGGNSGYSGERGSDTNTVGLWHLNGGTSGNIANNTTIGFEDTSGNSNNGTAKNTNGTGMAWAQGKIGGSTTFDGTDDYVEMIDSATLNPATQITLEMWFQPNETMTTYQGVLGKGGGNAFDQGYEFAVVGGSFGFWVNGDAHMAATTMPTNGELAYWVGTFDGSNIKLYKNGSLVSTSPYTSTITSTSLPFRIGRVSSDGGNKIYTASKFDEVRISNVARDAASILNYYNESNPQPKNATTLPAAPTIGTTTVDATGPTINWTEPTSTSGVTYKISRYLSSGTLDVADIKTGLTPGTTSWQDSVANNPTHTPLANTAYKYTVISVNSAGTSESAQSNAVTTYAAAPTIGTTTVDATGPTIIWTEPASTSGVTYKISRYLSNGTLDVADIKTGLTPGTTSWQDSAANDPAHTPAGNMSYKYTAISVNSSGTAESAQSNTVTTYPGAPTGLSATAASSSGINMTWTAPAGGADHYHVKYSVDSYATDISSNVVATAWNDTGRAANTAYTYRVFSVNASGAESVYAEITKSTWANAPINQTATTASNMQINLAWEAGANGTNHYHVRSSSDSYGSIKYDNTTAAWNETSLTANTAYTYRIYSVNADNVENTGYVTATATTLTNTPVLAAQTTPTNDNTPQIHSTTVDSSIGNRTVKLYDAATLVATTTAAANGTFTFANGDWGANVLADGNHTNITARAVNSAGADSAASAALNTPAGIIIDTQAPTTAGVSVPATGDGTNSWFKTNPIITLTPDETGTTAYQWDSPTLASPTTYTVPIDMNATIGQGTHTLYWRTTDPTGNPENIQSREYKLDSVAPLADTNSLVLGDGSEYINQSSGGLTDLHLTSSDATSGMYKTMISMDGLLYDGASVLCSFNYSGLIPNWDLETQDCGVNLSGDGTKTVYVKFSDLAGNLSVAINKSVTYDATNPGNTTVTTAKSIPSAPTPDITSSAWTKYPNPKFEWDGASDDTAGIKDYYVYFGTNEGQDPVTANTSANLFYVDNGNSNQTTTKSYIVTSTLTSGTTYYLKVRSRDNALNVSADTYTESENKFVYKFDNVAPGAISYVKTTPAGYSTTDSFTFEWDQVTDVSSTLAKYQYKVEDGVDDWHDYGIIPDPVTGLITLTDNHKYKDDANIIDVRAVDVAGNFTESAKGYYYFAGDIPAPKNVTVDLSHSSNQSVNSFAFSWQKPDGVTPQGYYYSINALPGAQNSTYVPYAGSSTTIGYAAFATRQGPNTFYVVTKANDMVGWTNYATPVTFSCNTSAPGIPENVMITDSSNRDSSRWQLTVNWDEPADVTADFNGYVVERSTDGTNYSEVATTSKTTTGYLDTGLLNVSTYYYRILAKDNTGNKSAASSVVSKQPTGKYTTPPNIVAEPKITILATKATVTWSTDREADSFVQVGATTSYGMTQGQLDSTTDHAVNLSGLTPGASYHYRAMWRDVDGNIGYSLDKTFKTQDAPGISEVTISDIRLDSAIISWKSTTISTSELHYGKTNTYGVTAKDQSSSSVTVHVIKLDTLDHSSTYHFKISSIDADGNVVSSDDYSFETLKFPIVSNFKVEQLKNMPTSTIKVTWDSNVPTTSVLTYSGHESARSQLELKHSITVTGLKDNTTYSIAATGRDQYGTEAVSIGQTLKTEFDTRPPEIINITSEVSTVGFGSETKGQAVISWETDEPSTAQVEYANGVSGDYYDLKTQEDTGLSTSHVVIITGLKPSSSYHFRVVSRDAADNAGRSDDNSILTEQASSSVFDLIINSLQNTIGWLFGAFSRN